MHVRAAMASAPHSVISRSRADRNCRMYVVTSTWADGDGMEDGGRTHLDGIEARIEARFWVARRGQSAVIVVVAGGGRREQVNRVSKVGK